MAWLSFRRSSSMLLTLFCAASAVLGSANIKREQPGVPETPPLKFRPLQWGDVNFIHTTDIHGWLEGHLLEESYTGDLGDFYSFAVRMKEKARRMEKDLFVVDTGDTHDGNGLSDTTDPHGKVSQPMLTYIPYDILTIGNHELYLNEITQDVYQNFVPHWNGRYLTSNVYIKDVNNNKTVPIGEKYAYFEGEFGTRVLAFGFLFDFTGNGDLSVVQKVEDEVKQPWFTEALTTHTPDVIALIGHTGLRFEEFKAVIAAIRQVYPYLPIAVLGGHTHIRDFAVYDAYAAGIESGRYLETVGFYSIDGIKESKRFIAKNGYNASVLPGNLTFHRRYLDQNRETYIFHAVDNDEKKFDTELGMEISKNITTWRTKLGINHAYGCAPQDYYLSAVPANSSNSIFTLLTKEVLPVAVTDTSRPYPAYIIMNSGGLRYDIYQGNFTLDNVYQISPFVDKFMYIPEVPYDVVSQVLDKMNGDSSASNYKKRSFHIEWESTCDDISFNHMLRRRPTLTPGYTTTDDLGSDGDDTKHSEIPYYEAKSFLATDLPSNTSSPVDLVFIDFVKDLLVSTMVDLTGKNWTVEPTYGDPNITSSSMWIKFAQIAWQNCTQ